MKLLFVCTGNICRSPTAEGVMIAKLAKTGLDDITTDSCGTHSYHVGCAPDPRSVETALKRGYDFGHLKARKFQFADYYEFDHIFCMDASHYEIIKRGEPDNKTAQTSLFLEFAGLGKKDVPDPYYGGQKGFDDVLDMIEKACDNIINGIKSGRI